MEDPITAIEVHRKRVEAMNKDLSPSFKTPMEFWEWVLGNPKIDWREKKSVARDAGQFMHPKLSAQAIMHDDGTWAQRLEKAIERSERVRLNGNRAKVINGEGPAPKVIEHEPQAKVQSLRRL
jgi:hypothetical protein